MIIAEAEKRLKKNILGQYIFQCDINDKFFLTRQISKLYPEIDIRLISKAVDNCNSIIQSQISKDDFARLFLDQLFLILEKELEI